MIHNIEEAAVELRRQMDPYHEQAQSVGCGLNNGFSAIFVYLFKGKGKKKDWPKKFYGFDVVIRRVNGMKAGGEK